MIGRVKWQSIFSMRNRMPRSLFPEDRGTYEILYVAMPLIERHLTHTHTYAHTHTDTQIQTHTRTHTHRHTHTYTHAHTHT